MTADGESRKRDTNALGLGDRRSYARLDFALRFIDSGIPSNMLEGDIERLRRARTIAGFTIILTMLGFESSLYFHWALPADEARLVDLSLTLGLMLVLGIPRSMRKTGETVLAANLMIAGAYTVILTAVAVFGGIRAPLLHWVAFPPVLAILMGTRRSAGYWSLICIATVAILAALDSADIQIIQPIDSDHFRGPALWLQRSVDVGSWLVVLLTIAFVYEKHQDEQTQRLESKNTELIHEMEQRMRAEERTRYLAYYDELTTLPNRQLFKEQLAHAMQTADREHLLVGLLFLDLDGFKEINDTHGHNFGDMLLQQVSRRLLNFVRGVDSVARPGDDTGQFVSRLGGDEFTILLDGLNDFSEAAIVAHRVLEGLAAPFTLGEHEVFITASIGIALYPGGAGSMDELLRNADLAMYHAKEEGRNNFQFFENNMNEDVVERTTLAHDLRIAIESNQLELDYQPIVDAQTLEISAVETLVRWRHPVRGRIQPDSFIKVAEDCGLIVALGDWVIQKACKQFALWKKAGIAPGRIAINVSGQQFRVQRLSCAIITAVEENGLDPKCIELEITENAMMIDEGEAIRCLEQLSRYGVGIALDDFGTGYSSLSYIMRFPVSALKIDRSFIDVIESDPEAQAISTAIIAMAQRLDLRVVGEGVEFESQAELLRSEFCDELQGYLYSPPLGAKEMTDLLGRGIG